MERVSTGYDKEEEEEQQQQREWRRKTERGHRHHVPSENGEAKRRIAVLGTTSHLFKTRREMVGRREGERALGLRLV